MKIAPAPSTLTIVGDAPVNTMQSLIDPEGARRLAEITVNLYSDPELAVARESVSNAVDSSRRAGSTIPVDITIPTMLEPLLVISDHGTGMSVTDVERAFLAFAASTKRDSNEYVGGLGVGAKSPWTISESFTVDTVKDGRRTMVRASKTLTHEVLLSDAPTDLPNGTTISIPVKVTNSARWVQIVNEVASAHDEGAVTVNGKPVVSIATGPARIGPVLCKRIPEHNSVVIRSGGTLFDSVYSVNNKLRQYIKLHTFVIELPIGSFDHTPSRESIIDTERTWAAIETAMEQYQAEYDKLSERINKLAETDVTAAVKLRQEITGGVGDYNFLPINLNLEVPAGIGAWVGGKRWERVSPGGPVGSSDVFSATSWFGQEAQRTIIVTDVPAGRQLRTFATFLKDNHSSARRVIPIPAGQDSVNLVVSSKDGGDSLSQVFRVDATMVPESNRYTFDEWSAQIAALRTTGVSRGPASGYTCLVVAQDGDQPKEVELTAAQIVAMNLPVWYVEDSGKPGHVFRIASVGVVLGRRKSAKLLASVPNAMTIWSWRGRCVDAMTAGWTHMTKLALALQDDNQALARFRALRDARDCILARGGNSMILMDQAAAVLAAVDQLTASDRSAWESVGRAAGRQKLFTAIEQVNTIESAAVQAWPLLSSLGYSVRGGDISVYVEYVTLVPPRTHRSVNITDPNQSAS